MTGTIYEGMVEKGKIRLKTGIHLHDNIKVYVIVPENGGKENRTSPVSVPGTSQAGG